MIEVSYMAIPGINFKKEITIEFIQETVCNYFNITPEQLHKNTRKRETVQARQIAMYFSKNHTKHSLAVIGTQIGNKDHATVLYACKTVNNLADTDKLFKKHIEELEKKIDPENTSKENQKKS